MAAGEGQRILGRPHREREASAERRTLETRMVSASCTPASPARDAALGEMVARGVDWREVMRLAERHRVGGLVFAALQSAGVTPDPPVGQALAVLALRIRRQNHLAAIETVALQQALDQAGIAARFFKGAALAQILHGSLDLKHSKDIDVLVGSNDAPALVALLEERGYRMWTPAPRVEKAHWPALLRFHKDVAMVRPEDGMQVEPHWRLGWNPRLLRYLDAEAPARTVELPGRGAVRTFGLEDLFTYLCVHGIEHSWSRLKWLADLHALIAPLPPAEIEALYRYAERRRVGPSAAVALALCESVFGLPIPPGLRHIVRARWVLRQLEKLSMAAMLADAEHPGRWGYFRVHALIAWAQGYFWTQLLLTTVGTQDVLRFPLPRFLHFLYPALRFPLYVWREMHGGPKAPPLPSPAAGPEVAER